MVEPLDRATRERFVRQGRRDTRPEVVLRSELHRMGLRFRIDRSPMPGCRSRADIVFGPSKVAVFVDGCFWHRCPVHGTEPKNNAQWWADKLDANVARDVRVDHQLRKAGWCVVRVWEHEDLRHVAGWISAMVETRRPGK